MTYSCNRYYQAYLCAYDKIKYTTESFKKSLSVIFSKHSFRFVPLVFIFILTIIIDFDSHKHKNLIPLEVVQHIYKIPHNVHMDFDPSNDSTKINLLYSQKIIHDDFFTNPKMLNNIEKKLASKKTKTVIYVIGNQVQLTGQERRNGFIAEFKSARPNSEIFEVPT